MIKIQQFLFSGVGERFYAKLQILCEYFMKFNFFLK